MSQSPTFASSARFSDQSADEVAVLDAENSAQDLLSALNDAGCRDILDATGDDALSAKEVSEACDLPLSTAYRKLDTLTDAGLLEERTRLRRSGKHASEYARLVEDVVVSLETNELRISRRSTPRSAAIHAPQAGD